MKPLHICHGLCLLFWAVTIKSQDVAPKIFVGLGYSIGATRIIGSTGSSSSSSTKSLPTKSQSILAEWFNNTELVSLGIKITRCDVGVKYSVHAITFEDYDGYSGFYSIRKNGYQGSYADQSSRLGISGTIKIGLFRKEIDPLLKLYTGLSFGTEHVYKRTIERNYFYNYSSGSGISAGPAPDYDPYSYSYFNKKDETTFTEKYQRSIPKNETCLELFIAPRLQLSTRFRIALEISRKYYFRSVLSDIPSEFLTKHNYLSLVACYQIYTPVRTKVAE